MRRRLALAIPLALLGCGQEISILPKDTDLPVPDDTDPGLPLDQPDIELSTEQLLFGALPPGCITAPQIVTITNVGTADLDITSIELAGPGKVSFAKQGRARLLAPQESMDVTVTFSPTLLELYDRVRLEVASNDPDEGLVDVDLKGEGSAIPFREELFVQAQTTEVDVLFSIDYSGSMTSDIADLASSFDLFIDSFVNLGLDYHIGVITADPDCPEFKGPIITPLTADPRAEFTSQTSTGGCGGEAAFGASMNALSAPAVNQGYNATFLRPNATLAIVGISDEGEQTEGSGGIGLGCSPPLSTNGCMPVRDYTNWLFSMKPGQAGHVSFSGIVGPRTSGSGSCSGVDAAPRYHDAINTTGGVWGNLCNLDLTPFLTHLSFVAAGLEYQFELDDVPSAFGPSAITVEVSGVEIPYHPINGWTFDEANNAVVFHGTAIPEPGDTVLITYPYEAICD